MPRGNYARCEVMKDTGRLYKGIPIRIKCNKKEGHDGPHKDTKDMGFPVEWESE